jgi:hypothetical protein
MPKKKQQRLRQRARRGRAAGWRPHRGFGHHGWMPFLGCGTGWLTCDDEIAAHKGYIEFLEEELAAAKEHLGTLEAEARETAEA